MQLTKLENYVLNKLGNDYLPNEPRIYKSKAKNAQEAHECIRPTNVKLTPRCFKKIFEQR